MSLVQPPRHSQSGKLRRDCRTSYAGMGNFAINRDSYRDLSQNYRLDGLSYDCTWPVSVPCSKKRKISDLSCESTGMPYEHQYAYRNDYVNYAGQHKPPKDNSASHLVRSNDDSLYASTSSKRDRSKFEDDEVVFMSRDEIERCSPSRKDGIDPLHETHLRYSYCAFLQNLGVSLDLPQTTIGTAMVLCHRFFVRRSHASHDRFLIATAVLFLAAKSEETARPLDDVISLSCQILHKQDVRLLSYNLPIGWFEQYRERITEAEQLILTTLNFELNVQHPFESLTATLKKLGFQQSVIVNLALNFVSEGLRSSLWLQFRPHQIAGGAAYLAAKFLNMNLASSDDVWLEFHTTPSVLKDVAHQLMELL
ncbi:hypothetical protein ABFS82_07G029400 [Erythranthe guttata]|nr:PREDICTED: cyclin-T1-4-like isoform X1 [Erythranthe guttata]|eukprot:XP_012832458.1 PREDICTED: cyclin-T1-4-like isoform X1 [Erythranthe guttata]